MVFVVNQLIKAMSNDFRIDYDRAYGGEGKTKALKERLYQKLKGLPEQAVYDGYELCIERKPGFMPTVPEIVAGAVEASRRIRREERNKIEANAVAALPAPKHDRMPPNLKAMFQQALASSSSTEEDRKGRLADLEAKHNALIADHYRQGKIHHRQPSVHLCAACGKLGVLSHSNSGGGNFYCPDHFKDAG